MNLSLLRKSDKTTNYQQKKEMIPCWQEQPENCSNSYQNPLECKTKLLVNKCILQKCTVMFCLFFNFASEKRPSLVLWNVDQDTLHLDPDSKIYPNLDPDPSLFRQLQFLNS